MNMELKNMIETSGVAYKRGIILNSDKGKASICFWKVECSFKQWIMRTRGGIEP